MVGITLSPEQIHQASPEVRHWLEQQIATTLGLSRPEPQLHAPSRHLIGCSLDQARGILALIQGIVPAVGVFFELGRERVVGSGQGLRALRLDEMARHARLQSPDQVVACLAAIDEALQRASGDSEVALTTVDGTGHCLVADATAQSILALWQELVMARNLGRPPTPAPAEPPQAAPLVQAPFKMSVGPFAAPEATVDNNVVVHYPGQPNVPGAA